MPPTRIDLRALLAIVTVVFTAVTLMSVASSIGTSTVFRHSLETVVRDTRGAAIADEMELSVLMHNRLSNLLVATGDPDVERARNELTLRLERLLADARDYVGSDDEQRLVERLSSALPGYLSTRDELERQNLELDEILQSAAPSLNALVLALESLRDFNDAQVSEAHSRALEMNDLTRLLAGGAAMLLVGGFIGLALVTRRFLSRPIIQLHKAMNEYRNGNLDVRSMASGVRELAELSRMFNEMAATLREQRNAQLAFVAGVAHDLRNPLSTMKNWLYSLELDESEEKRRQARAMLDEQVNRLVRMVDDFMDATRIEAGHLELRRNDFDLSALVDELVGEYATLATRHQLVSKLPSDGISVQADRLRLEQVLRNLLSNAVKYSSEGQVVVTVCEEGDVVVIAVSDQGAGIPQDQLSNIFLPFQRRTVEDAPGAGLGLSTVQRIVTAHGGTVEVESHLGKGSTFRVRLPRFEAHIGEDRRIVAA